MQQLRRQIKEASAKECTYGVRFYLVETRAGLLTVVQGCPFYSKEGHPRPWVPSFPLLTAWISVFCSLDRVIIMAAETDNSFMIRRLPWTRDRDTRRAAADLIYKTCKTIPWNIPWSIAKLIAGYQTCICEGGDNLRYAMVSGHVCCVEKAQALGKFVPKACAFICNTAARYGRLPLFEWAHAHGCPCTERASRLAAFHGHRIILQFMEQEAVYGVNRGVGVDICREAAAGNHLELVRWLLDTGACTGDAEGMSKAAARNGALTVLQWLYNQKLLWHGDLCCYAAYHGETVTLQWLHDRGFSLNLAVSIFAAAGGSQKALLWLQARACPWGVETSAAAARMGHLRVLKWLHAQGCPWDERGRLSEN